MHGPPFFLFFFPMLFPIAAVVFFGWLGLRFVRAKEQATLGAASAAGAAASRAELARIEESLDAVQHELQKLQERQTFVEKLLERPRDAR